MVLRKESQLCDNGGFVQFLLETQSNADWRERKVQENTVICGYLGQRVTIWTTNDWNKCCSSLEVILRSFWCLWTGLWLKIPRMKKILLQILEVHRFDIHRIITLTPPGFTALNVPAVIAVTAEACCAVQSNEITFRGITLRAVFGDQNVPY